MKKKVFLFLFCFLLSAISFAQPVQFKPSNVFTKNFFIPAVEDSMTVRFASITINEGLSQGFVPCIFQDKKGYMWFGTKDGLNKYDGYKFTVYRHDANDSTSIADNYMDDIFEDSRGYIWVGTAGQGLDVFNPLDETFFHIGKEYSTDDFMVDGCLSIGEDAEGNLWFYSGRGNFKITITQKKNAGEGNSFGAKYDFKIQAAIDIFHQKFHLLREKSKLLRIDCEKNLWLTFHDSLYEISGNKMLRWKKSDFTQFDDADIAQIISDKKNQLIYFISNKGISIYDISKKQIVKTASHISHDVPYKNSSIVDQDGNLWIYYAEGFYFFDTHDFHFSKILPANIETNLPINDHCSSALCDKSGIVWIGTNGYGLLKYNPRTEKFHRISTSPDNIGSITGIRSDNHGKIYLNCNKSFQLFDVSTGKISDADFDRNKIKQPNKADGFPGSFVQDSKDIYWFDYGYGTISRFDEKTNTIKFFQQGTPEGRISASAIWLDENENVWISVQNSRAEIFMCSFNQETEKFNDPIPFPDLITVYTYPFISKEVNATDGSFWLGTLQGLYNFNPKNNKWIRYQNEKGNKNSLSYNIIFSLCADPKQPEKYLWVGTNSGGLNRFDIEAKTFVHFTDKEGLPNNVVYGILNDDDGNLWLSTNKGLCRFNMSTFICKNYYASDGLQGNEFNRYAYCRSKDGILFFGGVSGINFFNPRDIAGQNIPPTVSFTGFSLFNHEVSYRDKNSPVHQSIDYLDEIILSHSQNMITFEFAAMDYSAPEKNQYKYKLENFDDDWISSGTKHEATYTNLDPGEYTFMVKAANSEGVWNETARTIHIIVHPPWWATWWARVFYLVLGAFLIFSFVRFRTKNLRAQQKLLEDTVEQRTNELKETQNQLAQQEKLSSLAEMSTGIANEIENPLSFVNSFSEVSKNMISNLLHAKTEDERNKLGEDLTEVIEHINENGKKADAILKNMLLLSRRNTGEKELADLNHLIEETTNLGYQQLNISSSGYNFEMKKSFANNLPPVKVVSQDIINVILNLMSNASFAMHEKFLMMKANRKPFVPLLTVSTSLENNDVVIRVRDNGIGIHPLSRDKIFEPFFTTKAEGQGTGLGLSISYDIVKAHNGEIKFETELGEFTEFALILPTNLISKDAGLKKLKDKVINEEPKKITKVVVEEKLIEKSAELIELNEELKSTMEKLEETQSALVQNEKLASLGQLTASIAHEIQNPLNFVNNFSVLTKDLMEEFLSATSEEERADIAASLRVNLSKINHYGNRAESIVKGMLAHNRETTGGRRPTDINYLCEQTLNMAYYNMRSKVKDFNCEIEKSFGALIPLTWINPQDITNVISNLLDNAFFSVNEKQKGNDWFKPKVSVRTTSIPGTVTITVFDNGNGIPKQNLDKIFQPFFTTKHTSQGAGLGLSIAYDIIKEHGGTINVDSNENEFTVMIVSLPV